MLRTHQPTNQPTLRRQSVTQSDSQSVSPCVVLWRVMDIRSWQHDCQVKAQFPKGSKTTDRPTNDYLADYPAVSLQKASRVATAVVVVSVSKNLREKVWCGGFGGRRGWLWRSVSRANLAAADHRRQKGTLNNAMKLFYFKQKICPAKIWALRSVVVFVAVVRTSVDGTQECPLAN